MKTLMIAAIACASALMLAACGGGGGGGSAPTQLEQAQYTAQTNAEFNASIVFQGNHSQYAGYTVSVAGDPAVTESCLQGSGWGNVTLTKGADVVAVACPTFAQGDCIPQSQSHNTACSATLRYPLPTLSSTTGH